MMTTAKTKDAPAEISTKPVVNDFQIVVATINGTGSQTANNALLRALFKMGLPISGKNLFPSNIQGLPCWFTIRVSKDGYTARRENAEILVAMNVSTSAEDIQNLPPGGVCIYPVEWNLTHSRDDVTYYPLPVEELVKQADLQDKRLRDYIANMVYVGALAEMLGIELSRIEEALLFHFGGKTRPVQSNMGVVSAAAGWTRENLEKLDPYRVEPMQRDEPLLIVDGNSASALGAVFGGVSVAAWYPITPSTSLMDALTTYLHQLRTDPESGQRSFSVIQAEDELSAIGMVIGAGWMGARAMTSTSGPGISLMGENVGYAYFAEVPAVIWDIQRVGPSTGMPTRTSQADLLAAYFSSHGDTRHIVLLPGNMQECFRFGWEAFDLAERFQTPVFVLSDLDLGMNLWMTPPFEYPDKPMDRGKVLTKEDLDRMENDFYRYEDVDGDGITYRTLPGTEHPQAAYFTRGSGHNSRGQYTERADEWQDNQLRLMRKHESARKFVPGPVIEKMRAADFGIIAYGSTDPAVQEARDRLKAEGIKTSYLRLRALPLSEEVRKFIESHDRVYVVELNADGQLAQLLRMEYPELAARIRPAAHLDGLPLTARWMTNAIMEQEG